MPSVPTNRPSLRDQRGQTAAEYLGLLLVVVAIVGILAATPIGGTLRDGIQDAICRVTGGECGSGGPGERRAAGRPPLSECVRKSSQRGINGAVKAFWVELGGGVKALREERADGTVKISLSASAKAGLEFSSPGATIDAGSTEGGTGEREIEIAANGEAGKAWVFENADDADDFVDDVEKKVKAIADPRWNFPGTDDDADIELPPSTETTVQGGVSVRGKAELASGTGLDGNLGAGIGATFNDKTGEKTVFFELAGGGGASTGSRSPFALGASGQGKSRVAITYDKEGQATKMRVIGQLDVTADAKFADALEGADLEQLMRNAEKLTAKGGEQAGGRLVVDAALDLRDPENQAAAQAFIDGRDPATGASVDRFDAGRALFDRFQDDAVVNARVYGLRKSDAGVDVDLGAFGVEAQYTTEDASLIDAWYRDLRDGDLRRWEQCTRDLA